MPDNASQLPGCICISSCTFTENRSYGNILHSPTLFSPCKQTGLNIVCCLIKLFLAMKEPPFCLDMNNTLLFAVLSPPWMLWALKDQSNQMLILGVVRVAVLDFLVGVFLFVCFFWKREVLCPTWLTRAGRKNVAELDFITKSRIIYKWSVPLLL